MKSLFIYDIILIIVIIICAVMSLKEYFCKKEKFSSLKKMEAFAMKRAMRKYKLSQLEVQTAATMMKYRFSEICSKDEINDAYFFIMPDDCYNGSNYKKIVMIELKWLVLLVRSKERKDAIDQIEYVIQHELGHKHYNDVSLKRDVFIRFVKGKCFTLMLKEIRADLYAKTHFLEGEEAAIRAFSMKYERFGKEKLINKLILTHPSKDIRKMMVEKYSEINEENIREIIDVLNEHYYNGRKTKKDIEQNIKHFMGKN